ncbi:hypothetical protein ES703_26807 [subsurface metagenome]
MGVPDGGIQSCSEKQTGSSHIYGLSVFVHWPTNSGIPLKCSVLSNTIRLLIVSISVSLIALLIAAASSEPALEIASSITCTAR